MKRTLRLLIAILLSAFVTGPVGAGQAPDKASEDSAVRKESPRDATEPDARKSASPKAGFKKPITGTFPTPSGPDQPSARQQSKKSATEPDARKGASPKAGSKKPNADTFPPPMGTEGPEMRKGEQKKAQ